MVDLDARGNGGTRRVVPKDIAHVVEQPGGGQQDGGRLLFAALHAFHEKFRVGVTVSPRRREPFVGGVRVLGTALAHEVQLYRAALQELRALLCADRTGQRGVLRAARSKRRAGLSGDRGFQAVDKEAVG